MHKILNTAFSEGREERRAPFWTVSGRLISFIVIFFVLNIFVYLRIGHIFESNTELTEPPVRPPYTVLGEIYKYTDVRPSKSEFLVNAPTLATQVSRAEPDKVFSVDTHKWLGDFGTLSPPDRHLHVTSTVSPTRPLIRCRHSCVILIASHHFAILHPRLGNGEMHIHCSITYTRWGFTL
jgi:hypothetical protein